MTEICGFFLLLNDIQRKTKSDEPVMRRSNIFGIILLVGGGGVIHDVGSGTTYKYGTF